MKLRKDILEIGKFSKWDKIGVYVGLGGSIASFFTDDPAAIGLVIIVFATYLIWQLYWKLLVSHWYLEYLEAEPDLEFEHYFAEKTSVYWPFHRMYLEKERIVIKREKIHES